MSNKTTNGRAEVGFPPMMVPFGFDAFMELNRPALTAMAQLNGRVYDSLATINRNWVDFVNRRLKEDLGVPKQLAACKTAQEMYSVYADFFQTAVSDYRSEFEQMSKLGRTLADDTVQAVQTRTEEVQREMRSN
jgi:Phasin protein